MTSGSASDTAGVRLTALGSQFLVTGTDDNTAASLRRQWSRLPERDVHDEHVLTIDLGSIPEGQQSRALLSQVTIQAIEAAAGTRLMLHAAGLADPLGRVLALVGPSGMGKTTASVYLSRHGFGYVTDETVSIGLSGDVLPFARPLSLRRPDGEVQRSPDDLGLGVPADGLHISRIVLLERDASHTRPPTLTSVPLLDALLGLIPHASALTTLPGPLQLMSRIIERCGGVLKLTYAEMDEPVLWLLSELLGAQVGVVDPWHELDHRRPTTAPSAPTVTDGRRVFRGSVRDGIVSRGEALVLVDDIPIRLSQIGLAIWEAAEGGFDPEDIASLVEQRHGPHPDGPRIVAAAVGQMLAAGLLVGGPHRPLAARTARR